MIRNLVIAVISCIVVAAAAYLGGAEFIDSSLRSRLALLPKHAQSYSLLLSNVGYEDMTVSLPREIRFRNLRAGFRIAGEGAAGEQDKLVFRADGLTIVASDMSYRDLSVALSGVKIRAGDAGRSDVSISGLYDGKPYGVDCERVGTAVAVDPSNPRAAVTDLFQKLATLPESGYASHPIDLRCNLIYQLHTSLLSAPLRAEERDGKWRVLPDMEALKQISAKLDFRPGPAELSVMSGHVLATPVILQMRETASAMSKTASTDDKLVQRRLYFDIILGYFLGRRFSEQFVDAVVSAMVKDAPPGDAAGVQRALQLGRQMSSKIRSEPEIRAAAVSAHAGRTGTASYSIR